MGGRGGNSVFTSGNGLKESGLDVTFQGETTRYYFTKKGNDNYYQQGFSGMPQPTPQNMSATEFRQCAGKWGNCKGCYSKRVQSGHGSTRGIQKRNG